MPAALALESPRLRVHTQSPPPQITFPGLRLNLTDHVRLQAEAAARGPGCGRTALKADDCTIPAAAFDPRPIYHLTYNARSSGSLQNDTFCAENNGF